MVDWTRLDITGQVTEEELRTNCGFEFMIRTVQSGKLRVEQRTASFLGMIIIIWPDGRIYLEGSLHKFWNQHNGQGNQNWNLFRLQDCIEAITCIADTLGIDPARTPVLQFEYGINILLGKIPASEFLRTALICHQNRGFDSRLKSPGKVGEYADFVHSDFYAKVYNKGLQYDRSEQIVRFEIKTRRRAFNRRLGVYNLSDLMSRDVWLNLTVDLTRRFESDLLVLDPIQSWSGTQQDLAVLKLFGTSSFWEGNRGVDNRRERIRARRTLCVLDENVQPLFSWHIESLHKMRQEVAKLFQSSPKPSFEGSIRQASFLPTYRRKSDFNSV